MTGPENAGAEAGSGANESPRQEVSLPVTMPEAWVEQLTKLRPSLLPTLLGSAVLAATIGWASSYFTARMTISANLQLEEAKVNLQLAQEQRRARTNAFLELGTSLEDLHQTFLSYLTLVQIAAEGGIDKRETASLSQALAEIGKAESKVVRAEGSPSLASEGLSEDIDACLTELTPAISRAMHDPKSMLGHRDLDARLMELTARVQRRAYAQGEPTH